MKYFTRWLLLHQPHPRRCCKYSLYKKSVNLLLLPGKIACLTELGNLFFRRNQIDRAVESFKSALEQAKNVYSARQPQLPGILNNLGIALKRAGMLDESLRYFQKAKKIMEKIQGATRGGNLTSFILNNIGAIYYELGDFWKALLSFKDALDMSITCCERYEAVCTNVVATVRKLRTITLSEQEASKIQAMTIG